MDTQTLTAALYILIATLVVISIAGLIHSARPLIQTIRMNAMDAMNVQRFYWRHENTPQMVIDAETLAETTKGTFAQGINNIYVGYCRDHLPRGTNEGAHAHVDGTNDICMFEVQGEARTEWVLAHELGHLIAHAKFASCRHDKTWKNIMFALGYGEDARRYIGETPSALDVSIFQTRNPVMARLTAAIDAEVDGQRPNIIVWQVKKIASRITSPTATTQTQSS